MLEIEDAEQLNCPPNWQFALQRQSPKNLTLLAFWDGPETRHEMETRLGPVLEQLEQIANLPFGRNLTIECRHGQAHNSGLNFVWKSESLAHAKTQEYTGDQMKHLILASTEIRSIGTPFSSDIADLLDEIRELHIFGQTLGDHTNNAAGFTPKLHWLLAHGPDFSKRWGWFAWISEQGIEHLHHILNKQSKRFMRYKGDELLQKIGEHQTLLNSIIDRQISLL
ncbi:hypothetical protein niasHS_010343 [Heterodera schachtii]|uniref:Uncharacterized protein n=2 Tax=Heterodera TaxID=34509 RepID=A0ABD2IZH7_HETSC